MEEKEPLNPCDLQRAIDTLGVAKWYLADYARLKGRLHDKDLNIADRFISRAITKLRLYVPKKPKNKKYLFRKMREV